MTKETQAAPTVADADAGEPNTTPSLGNDPAADIPSSIPAKWDTLVLEGWREPRSLDEAYTLLASARILRAHGEATTRASWLDLAKEQEAAVAQFLSLPEPVPEVGAGRELVPAPADEAVPGLRDTVRNPDKTTALASAERMKLASDAHSLELAVDMAETIGASNSVERALAHQMAVAHRMAMEFSANARTELAAYRCSHHLSPHRSIEASRMANTGARLMETFQRGALTLDRLRNGGRQVVQVQHVTVSDGGQAVVAGTIQPGEAAASGG